MKFRKSSEKGVTHWVDGSAAWKLGVSGFFIRARGMIGSALIGLPLAGVPFWWPEKIPNQLVLEGGALITHLALVFVVLVAVTLFYMRTVTKRSLSVKSCLHHIAHESRDAVGELYSRTPTGKPGRKANKDPIHEKKHMVDFSNGVCEAISRFYSKTVNDETIGCAIRLGVKSGSSTNSEIKYVTVGRGGALSRSRGATSEPIKRSEGIPKFFLSADVACKGVLFYDDLVKATANDAYKKTKNDEMYKDDIKTMVVAPINGWNGVKIDLVGLLYITSKSDKLIKPKHVDVMKFTADHLAIVFSSMFARLYSAGLMPQFEERESGESI